MAATKKDQKEESHLTLAGPRGSASFKSPSIAAVKAFAVNLWPSRASAASLTVADGFESSRALPAIAGPPRALPGQ